MRVNEKENMATIVKMNDYLKSNEKWSHEKRQYLSQNAKGVMKSNIHRW